MDLTMLFKKSGGAPVSYEGRVVQPSFWLPVVSGDRLQVDFYQFVGSPVQGLVVSTRMTVKNMNDGCRLQLAGHQGSDFVLWTDTAPRQSEIVVVAAPLGSEIGFWNVWRHPRYPTMLYGLNNAGIEAVQEPGGAVRLQCSDGMGGADFDDLVVVVKKK